MTNLDQSACALAHVTATLVLLVAGGLAGCHPQQVEANSTLSSKQREDLRVGYTLLDSTLADEARLGKLDFLKTVMLDGANDEISSMMDKLSDASAQRSKELTKLRQLGPDVSGEPKIKSPMGHAINEVAKKRGKSEMLSRAGGFDVRFVLVQAQATRMVSAIATAIARFDPNPERKAWLGKLSEEYEGYRDALIRYLDGKPAEK